MAKIKLSGLVSDVAGKLNGSVFQRSKAGLSLRTNPKKKMELSARQKQTFYINTLARKAATIQTPPLLVQMGTESQRHPRHSNFATSYYIPAGAWFGKRTVEFLAYGGAGWGPQPAGIPPQSVTEDSPPAYNTGTRILEVKYTPELTFSQDWKLVIDLQLSRSYTGSWSPDRWKHLGWYAPTPPNKNFLIQAGFFPDYLIKNRRMFYRLRLLVPDLGLWTNSLISEVVID
jgi:hypothetical protein